jgi:hypothetical protein
VRLCLNLGLEVMINIAPSHGSTVNAGRSIARKLELEARGALGELT